MFLKVYKSLNCLNPEFMWDMFKYKHIPYSLRSEHLLEIPYANTYNYGINSVLFRGSILWNSINNDIKTAENLNVFKRITKEWNGDKCNCKICQ